MITGDSRQQIVPPTRIRVKAGFVVYSPDSDKRNIVILDEGELAAVNRSGSSPKKVFTMHPGDLVGVASLLEHEPFQYNIEATQDSTITLITEECMESELKTLPVWLLAVIRNLSNKTRKLKEATHKSRSANTLKSLAEFCSHLNPKEYYPTDEILQEFRWQTKIPETVAMEDLKSLCRRKFVRFKTEDEIAKVSVLSPFVLQVFVDYLKSVEKNIPWTPFQLSMDQKKMLVKISGLDQTTESDAPTWLKFFSEQGLKVSISDWICAQNFGWFSEISENLFTLDTDKIKYYLAALHFENNIKGVL